MLIPIVVKQIGKTKDKQNELKENMDEVQETNVQKEISNLEEIINEKKYQLENGTTKMNTKKKVVMKKGRYKKNLMRTIVFCYTTMMLGLAVISYDLLLIDLAGHVHRDINNMGILYTARGISEIPTGIFTAWLLDKFSTYSNKANQEKRSPSFFSRNLEKILLIIGLIIIVTIFFLTPLVNRLWMLIMLNVIIGLGTGMIGITSNVFLIWIWKEAVNPYMQALHFSSGMGAFLAPLYLQTIHKIFDKFGSNRRIWGFFTVLNTSFFTLSFGICTAIVAFLFTDFRNTSDYTYKTSTNNSTDSTYTYGSVMDDQENRNEEQNRDQIEELSNLMEENKMNRSFLNSVKEKLKNIKVKTICIALMTGLSLMFYIGSEIGYGNIMFYYLRLYKKDDFSENSARYLTSLFWFTFTFGRLVSIPIAKYVSTRAMLLIDMTFTLLPIVGILISSHKIMIWSATALIGLAMASQYPTTVALPRSHLHMKMTGLETSIITLCGTIGAMVIPPLMTQFLHYLIWILFAAVTFSCVIYIILLFFVKKEPVTEASDASNFH
jgi:MFS family permease